MQKAGCTRRQGWGRWQHSRLVAVSGAVWQAACLGAACGPDARAQGVPCRPGGGAASRNWVGEPTGTQLVLGWVMNASCAAAQHSMPCLASLLNRRQLQQSPEPVPPQLSPTNHQRCSQGMECTTQWWVGRHVQQMLHSQQPGHRQQQGPRPPALPTAPTLTVEPAGGARRSET